jgi:hypothetical protein
MALTGFFLPWTHGVGPLAANEFTGFRLAGYAGRLQALDLTLAQGGALWLVRLLIVGVAVAGAWQLLLAPRHHCHRVYIASGWYLAGFAGAALALGLLNAGITLPPTGLALVVGAGALFAVARGFSRERAGT